MSVRIFIVDDDPSMREALSNYLALEGYELIVAANGWEAMQRIAAEQPDLILLDVSMPPGPDGYEVCNHIKSDPRTNHIPVTFLTFQGALDERQHGIEVGADDYLSKPVNYEVLQQHVRSQLRVARQPRQFEAGDSVIFTLAQRAEARDTYTRGHLRRLEHYSKQLALAAGVSKDELVIIRYGAVLHDIGKLRISDTILTKPGPLTSEEFAELKRHPEHGIQMIAHLRFAQQVSPIVLGHHEKWNGRGYPQELAGEEIPLGARIVAIADSYDAMTTDRPYRRALTQQEALRRLRARAGEQWDPQLVELFCSLIEQDKLSLPSTPPAIPNVPAFS